MPACLVEQSVLAHESHNLRENNAPDAPLPVLQSGFRRDGSLFLHARRAISLNETLQHKHVKDKDHREVPLSSEPQAIAAGKQAPLLSARVLVTMATAFAPNV